ncbi:FAD-dependent oxidoreductase [Dictyobacter formicarum]|uniref:Fused response regulator/thioredoxin-disulfide reductase n=1 Tax=Dictyobacter formicarum TaxID=2778368 RepID=A0ABQ3V939_9CHLR|nr:FAD-dependent oxidoreductase [Dictyobacter formicarum]GHO82299.1 fused response regulator/thioredoxin-disulfide reductase [Dictyobacter formicarum]
MQQVFFTVGKTFSPLDLASRYREYQVIQCQRGDQALDMLLSLRQLQVPVVLLMVDQHLPDMAGVTFLEQAKHHVPTAKCLLVTDQQAPESLGVLHVKVDALLSTCVPPEDFFFPVLDALLSQERDVACSPLFHGIRVTGHRWSAASHQVKDFLARHAIPFQWVDLETHSEARQMVEHGGAPLQFPILQFSDGSVLSQPTLAQLAEKLGLTMHSEIPFYDLIIIGAGPAGLASAVYGASEGLRTAVIERDVPGGQAGMSSRIENYLGFPIGLPGAELAIRGSAQAARLGAHMLSPQEVVGMRVADPYRYVTLADGSELGCYALVLATGVSYRTLAVPDLDRLTGSGVYYGAAMTEAAACQGRQVFVVGGANSAGQAALYFADYAQHVTLLVRGASLEESMSSYLLQEIALRDNITVETHTEVASCFGEEHLEHLRLRENTTGTERLVEAAALFIFIGATPSTSWLPDAFLRDQAGFVLTGPQAKGDQWSLDRDPLLLETSIPGIFAVGDVRAASIKRVASATGDGAVAVSLIHHYLGSLR